jgi:tRNA-2-methylthio-N6-dimethylallyladenosine synthase
MAIKFKIETIGCQMNISESEKIASELSAFGCISAQNIGEADLIILNTCSVRAQAEQKAFSFLGRAQELKKKNKNIKIAVIGCMAERLGAKIKSRFKSADLIIGSLNGGDAALKIMEMFSIRQAPSESFQAKPRVSEKTGGFFKAKPSEFVPIMRGCSNFCSYCIVPFVKGAPVSFDADGIIERCSFLSENGAREIILLGQNVNSYFYKSLSFAGLLEKISGIDGIARIRFMTNHPKDFSADLTAKIASIPKVCPHLHLPLQSASNRILDLMNRGYSFEDYCRLISLIRGQMPQISITTDIITGFPTETEEDFEKTLQAISEIKFDSLFAFKYSPRPDTKSFLMKDDIPLEEKKRRHQLILKKSFEISAQKAESMIGKTEEVLAQNYSDGILEARTLSNRKVFIKGTKDLLGGIFKVVIKEAKINAMLGEIV